MKKIGAYTTETGDYILVFEDEDGCWAQAPEGRNWIGPHGGAKYRKVQREIVGKNFYRDRMSRVSIALQENSRYVSQLEKTELASWLKHGNSV